MYLPLRMDKNTQEHVQFVVNKNKPHPDNFYFGLSVANRTVVAVFKSLTKIIVSPAGKYFKHSVDL